MAAESNIDELVFNAFFPGERNGVMIEIGAARPEFLSIGESFRAKGWRVISVEPNPAFANMHRALGHEIIEVACAETDADDVEFMVVEADGKMTYEGGIVSAESFSSLGVRGDYQKLLSTMKDRFTTRPIRVKTRRLDTILKELGDVKKLDIIAVDVEGWELECLRSFSYGPLAPKVAIVENLFHSREVASFMTTKGYNLWKVVPPNDIYIAAQ